MIKLKQLLTELRKLPRSIMEAELNNFSLAYIGAALATETDNSDPSGGKPLDGNYDFDDIEAETFARIIADCKDFQKKYRELYEKGGWSDESAGRDFWYTRNGHGTGFWDVGLGDEQKEVVGGKLTQAAKSYGQYDLYLGEEAYEGMIVGG